MTSKNRISRKSAVRFIVLLGFISLFADVTYEGARSITGPYMALLGASAAVVGAVAGAGELAGYTLRLASGYLADRTQRYWTLTILGYVINLAAVPALALAGRWEVAAVLIILERTGKAVRAPSRDAILSHATAATGRGWGFGLHEAMDQTGALIGPLLVAFILARTHHYQASFAVLAIPAVLALITLVTAQRIYPRPHELEVKRQDLAGEGFSRVYWLYVAGAGLLAAGYADFALIAYHFKKEALVPDLWIPVLYAVAMGVDAATAVPFGRLFDRHGAAVLVLTTLLSATAMPLLFLGSLPLAVAGMALWGTGMGAQQSVVRAAIADLAPPERRGSAYGVFNTGYGVCWFAGSALLGILYDHSVPALVVVSMSLQLAAIPIFLRIRSVFPQHREQ